VGRLTVMGKRLMRIKLLVSVAVAAVGAMWMTPALAAAPDYSGTTYYGDLGYANFTDSGANISEISGTLGVRVGQHWGGEFEISTGLNSSNATIVGQSGKLKVNEEGALYLVGFAPVSPNADLFAKIGFGGSNLNFSFAGNKVNGESQSANFGAGGQYFFDAHNGVRAEYIFHSVTNGDPNISTWTVSYVRKF
jgi:outer membrane immunogenic protein